MDICPWTQASLVLLYAVYANKSSHDTGLQAMTCTSNKHKARSSVCFSVTLEIECDRQALVFCFHLWLALKWAV